MRSVTQYKHMPIIRLQHITRHQWMMQHLSSQRYDLPNSLRCVVKLSANAVRHGLQAMIVTHLTSLGSHVRLSATPGRPPAASCTLAVSLATADISGIVKKVTGL
jgi:glycine cleavage system regulatory protein